MNNLNIEKLKSNLSNLNPKEIYSWPLLVQVFLGLLIFIIVLGLGTAFDLIQQQNDLEDAVKSEEKLKDEFLLKKKQVINLDLYKEQLDDITKTSDNLLKQLPKTSEIEKLLLDINQAGISKGLYFDLFKPDSEQLFDFYAELPIKIKVNGSYESIGKFASDVSQLSRVVILSDFSLSNKDSFISMEATAKTFRYLDSDELDRQKIEKAKAKKAKNSTKNEKEDKDKK
jgi:type IV pilus assembly protein PilO